MANNSPWWRYHALWCVLACIVLWVPITWAGEPEPAALLPQGNNGVAAKYPGDLGIAGDPAVIVAEDFESASLGKLQDGWRPERAKFVAPEHDLFPSRYALEWVFPQQEGPVGAGASHWFRPGFDQVFARVYWWLAPDLKVVNMHGWGIQAFKSGLDAGITTGHKAAGDDTFCAFLDYPFTDLSPYVYHPEQKTRFGDHFSSGFRMELGRWYCTELDAQGQHARQARRRNGALGRWHAHQTLDRPAAARRRRAENQPRRPGVLQPQQSRRHQSGAIRQPRGRHLLHRPRCAVR